MTTLNPKPRDGGYEYHPLSICEPSGRSLTAVVSNTLAAFVAVSRQGVTLDELAQGLRPSGWGNVGGEGVVNDVTVLDDYAHHPSCSGYHRCHSGPVSSQRLWFFSRQNVHPADEAQDHHRRFRCRCSCSRETIEENDKLSAEEQIDVHEIVAT